MEKVDGRGILSGILWLVKENYLEFSIRKWMRLKVMVRGDIIRVGFFRFIGGLFNFLEVFYFIILWFLEYEIRVIL